MQRKINSKTRGEFIVEYVVWNAAAGAALAVMVLLLLCTLQWLDQVSPRARAQEGSAASTASAVQSASLERNRTTELAAVRGPSG